ncbi:altronate hydrolase [Deltaproteobacteria bacterium Smac51]|nr:altronate hydrolase [Deltaproteobacteria bacterium Smac51]
MTAAGPELFIISPGDNVAVALADYSRGEKVSDGSSQIELLNDIPFGHKVALTDINEGGDVVKYGAPIGHAGKAIKKGEHIHSHNLRTSLGDLLEYEYKRDDQALSAFAAYHPATCETASFEGYSRADGRAGTRNEVWIIPLVGCVNKTAETLAEKARQSFGDRCDGIFAYSHNMGCSQMGDDQLTTQKILAGLINNPNAGAVLVLGLGCENNNREVFRPVLENLGPIDERRVRFLVTQDVEDELTDGLKLLDQLTAHAAGFKRERLPADRLVVGFKCGGSDAFSGITANALCGRISDRLVACGGSSILTEVPEMFGAETLLMARAKDRPTFEAIVRLINDYKSYFKRYQQVVYENPSPGNKAGGITTLEEKSLGCTQKGGRAPVVDVLDYGRPVTEKGLNLLIGSGNDQVSCTNLTAAGANLIIFTTGRGNPFGAPVPTIKVSSNDRLYERKKNWIDYNAGRIALDGGMEETADDFFSRILQVASGQKVLNELHGYREISIFRDGIIM